MSRRRGMPSPALIIALTALVFSTTGLADAARHAIVSAIAGHPVSTKPYPGGVLLLGSNRKFPASAIPTVKNASRVGNLTAEQLAGTCPPATVDLGTWCLSTEVLTGCRSILRGARSDSRPVLVTPRPGSSTGTGTGGRLRGRR